MGGATQAHCNRCGHPTNHDVLRSDRQEYQDWISDVEYVDCFDIYEMLKCRGCDLVILRITSKHIEDRASRVTYYPPAIARRAPAWLDGFDFLELPGNLFPLLDEIYKAAQNGLRCLAAMGI